MAKRIVYTRPDGGVSVVVPAPGYLAGFVDEDAAMAALMAKDVPADAMDAVVVDVAEVLSDREFRNAWVQSGGAVSVDVAKARDVQEARINVAKRTNARDLIEREMLGEDVTAEKAVLQSINAHQIVDAAPTPETLSAVWPAGLPRP